MDIALALWNLLVNPNVAYLLLVIGMWALIAAFATPGTGIPEVAATIFLPLAIMGLAHLPVNAIGLTLIIVSMIILVLDLNVQSHGALTLGGIVALALGSLLLFRPVEGQPGLSLWLVAFTTAGSALFFGVALTFAVRAQSRPPTINARAVIGQVGEVRDPLDPVGAVQLRSELWSARAETPGEVVEAGANVVVTELEGLTLIVKKMPR